MPARIWRKGATGTLLLGMQAGAATVKNRMEVPQKSKRSTNNSNSGHTVKGDEVIIPKSYLHPHIHLSIYNNQEWKQPMCPSMDRQIKKMWCVHMYTHTHQNIIQSYKKGSYSPLSHDVYTQVGNRCATIARWKVQSVTEGKSRCKMESSRTHWSPVIISHQVSAIFFLLFKDFICKSSLHPMWAWNSWPWGQELHAPLTELRCPKFPWYSLIKYGPRLDTATNSTPIISRKCWEGTFC